VSTKQVGARDWRKRLNIPPKCELAAAGWVLAVIVAVAAAVGQGGRAGLAGWFGVFLAALGLR
jgi:hypothetical protein